MSAAAARRRKQLAAKKKSQNVLELLEQETELSEERAYELLQLAQSSVRKQLPSEQAPELAYQVALKLLQFQRIAVASQMLEQLVVVLRETHTPDNDDWMNKITDLHKAHQDNIDAITDSVEKLRLEKLQREFLMNVTKWSSDIGEIKYGKNPIHQLLGQQCLKLEFYPDAMTHLCLAELPQEIATFLSTLPPPTEAETKAGHTCEPALRDSLLTRAVLIFCSLENLRDAHALVTLYQGTIEERDVTMLQNSYTKKDDGLAPSHLMFCTMLVTMCQKEVKTAPLFSWLIRSFKRELNDSLGVYTSKIGQRYFNIQPPPNMLSMMENMMGMMGGGGGGPNPAMMQQMMANLQGMQM